MARDSEHVDVRPGAEDLFMIAADDKGGDFGVFKSQAPNNVGQFNIDTEVVGVQFQLISISEREFGIHTHVNPHHLTLLLDVPVTILRGIYLEGDRFHQLLSSLFSRR